MEILLSVNVAASPERAFLMIGGADSFPLSGMSLDDFQGQSILVANSTQKTQVDGEFKIVDADGLAVKWRSRDRRMAGDIVVTHWEGGANVAVRLNIESESSAVRSKIEAILAQWRRRFEEVLGEFQGKFPKKSAMH